MINNLTWYDEFTARFGRKLSASDIVAWDTILREEVHGLTADELKAAVRRLGEMKRQGEFRYAPSVEDLISAVIKGRWEAKQAREGCDPEEGCAYCRKGWLTYCYSAKDGVRRLGSEAHRTQGWLMDSEATPCLCTRGQRALALVYKDKPGEHEGMRRWARKVMSWLDSIPDDAPFDDRKYIPHHGKEAEAA